MTDPAKSTDPQPRAYGGGQFRPVPEEETFKDTCESIVVAFVLAFIFRAYVVEAFVIPTGSMAPTLLGQHVRVTCEQCGYVFKAEAEGTRSETSVARPFVCPMCNYPNRVNKNVPLSAGDRILVHKYIYTVHEPQRWDVLVFKSPPVPGTNYIKRLVGLPQENLCILEGNIYVQDNRGDGSRPWQIARKTDRPKVQRAVWQPVYHSQYVPIDGGRGTSWRYDRPWRVPWYAAAADQPKGMAPWMDPAEESGRLTTGQRPEDSQAGKATRSSVSGKPVGLEDTGSTEGEWDLSGRHGYVKRTGQPGRIRFNFASAARGGGPGLYVYNQNVSRTDPQNEREPVEEVRVAGTFLPAEAGLSVAISTTNRFDTTDGHVVTLVARIADDGRAWLEVWDPILRQRRRLVEPVPLEAFQAGVCRQVELWYADQEVSLWVDGRRVLQYRFDLPMENLWSRRSPPVYPEVAIDVVGSPVTLYRVEVDRDLYYRSVRPDNLPLRGGMLKRESGVVGEPVSLKSDQYLCFGDNSPVSSDSRYWDSVDPWIKEKMLDGEDALGIVPGDLILGQAFFVYFPAPFKWFVPNFGELRFIH